MEPLTHQSGTETHHRLHQTQYPVGQGDISIDSGIIGVTVVNPAAGLEAPPARVRV